MSGQESPRPELLAMLEARRVALVGASERGGSFGRRMTEEVAKSPARPRIYPVNPRYRELNGMPCHASLADLPEAVDLALLAVPDAALTDQLTLAAKTGVRSAVIFGTAHGLREHLAGIAADAGMELCGAGCMGFINVHSGLRAIGYTEADPVPAGPVALVTHSGSVFSALLRDRRRLGFTLAVSSGQELVTRAPAYLDYALSLPATRVLGLVLEAIRDGAALRSVLEQAAESDVPVVLLATGRSERGRAMVEAHSGALAAGDGGWEALARAYGVHRVSDLAEFTDTLELFAAGRRCGGFRGVVPPGQHGTVAIPAQRAGLATRPVSGRERAHVGDLAEELGVPFAPIGPSTLARLGDLLDPGLEPANPLDVWGTGADTRSLMGASLAALADDPEVAAVALAVDLVPELDGDDSYPLALQDVAGRTGKPVVALSNLGSTIDPAAAGQLRRAGVPVLEGTRSGLLALRHLLDHGSRRAPATQVRIDPHRRARGRALLASGTWSSAQLLALLSEYGMDTARTIGVSESAAALAAAESIGYPVVLKTDEPAIAHKSDVGGVLLGIASPDQLVAGYADLAARLGQRVLVCQRVPAGVELALGLARDPELGPLVVVGAGGVLVELLADSAVALPPVTEQTARDLLDGLRVRALLDGVRGGQAADLGGVIAAIMAVSVLAVELGEDLEALDVNPLICGPGGAVAVDALAIPGRLVS